MKDDETRKTKQNNKTAILDKLRDSIVSEEVDSNDVEMWIVQMMGILCHLLTNVLKWLLVS